MPSKEDKQTQMSKIPQHCGMHRIDPSSTWDLEIGFTGNIDDRIRNSLDFDDNTNTKRRNVCLKDLQSLCCLRILEVKIKSSVKKGVTGNWSKMRYLSMEWTKGSNQDYLPGDMRAMKDMEYSWHWRCDVEKLPSWVSVFRKLVCLVLWSCEN